MPGLDSLSNLEMFELLPKRYYKAIYSILPNYDLHSVARGWTLPYVCPFFSDDVEGNKEVGTNKEVDEGHMEAKDVTKGNKVVANDHMEAKDVAKGN